MISALDHIALAVRDLDAAAARYATLLGRSWNWRGRDGGAEHVWFQLENTALDIIAPVGAGYTGDRVKAHLDEHGEGIWAVAFTTPDMARARRTLSRRGVEASEPMRIRSTHVETGDKRYWNTGALSASATHGANILLIEAEAEAWPLSPATDETNVAALDHIVIRTPNPERAVALYGARLGLDMRLDRANPDWGARLMFFRCGDLIVEIAHDMKAGVSDAPDALWGLSWRVSDAAAAQARLAGAGFAVSDVRKGRKPGTHVFTVRDGTSNVPTICVEPAPANAAERAA
ncbi:MAG: VOC family protein [Hyphomonadaceae bacterium]